jgi:hypothetical protein
MLCRAGLYNRFTLISNEEKDKGRGKQKGELKREVPGKIKTVKEQKILQSVHYKRKRENKKGENTSNDVNQGNWTKPSPAC